MWKASRLTGFLVSLLVCLILPPVLAQEVPADLLYTLRNLNTLEFEVYRFETASGQHTQVGTMTHRTSSAGWSPDGRFVYTLDDGTGNLTLFNVEDDTRQQVSGYPNLSCGDSFGWSPDARYLVYFMGNDPITTHLLDTRDGSVQSLPTMKDNRTVTVSWSPDGRYVAYVSGEINYGSMVILDVQTNQVVAKMAVRASVYTRWLPSGNRFAYPLPDESTVVVLNLDDGSEQRYPGDTIATASPDGRYLITSVDLIYEPRVPAKTILIDTIDGTYQTLEGKFVMPGQPWSPDNRYLAYSVQDPLQQAANSALNIYAFPEGSTQVIEAEPVSILSVSWSPVGHVVAFVQKDSVSANNDWLEIIDLDSQKASRLEQGSYKLAWSPDGQYLATQKIQESVLFNSQDWTAYPVDELKSYVLSVDWSPDGRYLAFLGETRDSAIHRVYILDTQDFSVRGLKSGQEMSLNGWRGATLNGTCG